MQQQAREASSVDLDPWEMDRSRVRQVPRSLDEASSASWGILYRSKSKDTDECEWASQSQFSRATLLGSSILDDGGTSSCLATEDMSALRARHIKARD